MTDYIRGFYMDKALVLTQTLGEGIYLEDLCCNLQQAAGKAIRALLIKHDVAFPYVHDIGELLMLLEDVGQSVPEISRQSAPHPLCCVHSLSRSCPPNSVPGVLPAYQT